MKIVPSTLLDTKMPKVSHYNPRRLYGTKKVMQHILMMTYNNGINITSILKKYTCKCGSEKEEVIKAPTQNG